MQSLECTHHLNFYVLRILHKRWNCQIFSSPAFLLAYFTQDSELGTSNPKSKGENCFYSRWKRANMFIFQVQQGKQRQAHAERPELPTVECKGQHLIFSDQQCSLSLGFGVWFWLLPWLLPSLFWFAQFWIRLSSNSVSNSIYIQSMYFLVKQFRGEFCCWQCLKNHVWIQFLWRKIIFFDR